MKKLSLAALALFALSTVVLPAPPETIHFTDVEKQTRQFMGWYETIKLTPEQDAVKKEALGAIPAPCCSNNSAYTCCCPCNMSRTIWGLSAHMIVNNGANSKQVRDKVQEWVKFIAPDGFSGDSCYRGGCGRPFNKNGCGGMKPEALTF
jgi:hypothetical protein